MDLLKVFLSSVGAVLALFLFTKLTGKKQMSQLSVFDYINGITIGSIAAEMATEIDGFLKPLIAMAVFAGATALIAFTSCKSLKIRKYVTGASIVLYDDGVLYKESLLKAKIDINEFLVQCRLSGYFNLADLQTAILEINGKISFLPKSINRPVTTKDLNISPKQDFLVANLILDGEIMEDILKGIGKDKRWLDSKLKEQNIKNISEIFLATCDKNENVSLYLNNKKKSDNIFK